ncbi:MAG: molybdopterin-dependent oxidoreductase, partial [Thermomonas sp.]
ICDQGGECELQDLSLGYGRSVSRFVERKRVVADEDMGPLVATEMTRCIQCTRCVRFTADVAGTYELGGMYRGENLQIGTYDGKPLTTELSGNVIDVCPVGALTNKVFRFKARPWELTARASLGYHDALGSNLFHHVRRGEILRSVPRDNEAVNECWLSDRDRYAHEGLYAADRATVPLIRDGEAAVNDGWREASWDEALAKAAQILRDNAADDLGILVHPSTSNEEGALLARLAEALGTGNLDHRIGQSDLSDGAVAEAFAVPVAEIEQADAIVIVGSHLRHEVPLLHQRLRKAVKRGAKVHVVNPVDFDVAFTVASKRIVPPSQLAEALARVELGDAANVAVIVGGVAENSVHAAAIRKAAYDFTASKNAKLCRIPQGANALGLSQHGVLPTARGTREENGTPRDAQAMLQQPRAAYVIYGIEPGLDFADQLTALKALGGAQVVAFSQFACQSTRRVADVILPVGALPEVDATLTNLDGVAQATSAAGKLPGQAHAGWRVLRALADELKLGGFSYTDLAGLRAGITPKSMQAAKGSAPALAGTGLEIAASQAIYRVDAVTRRAEALQAHPLNPGPRVLLHPSDASNAGLVDEAMAKLSTASGTATLQVVIDDRVAAGCAWIETGHGATAPLAASAKVEVVRA